MGITSTKQQIIKMGFYYQKGFYYDQRQGFYYDQQDNNFAAAWKTNENAKKVSEAAKKIASAKVAGVMIANNHKPGPTENRILSQISAERLAYEAAEIYMNSTPPDDKISADGIR